MTVKEIDEAFEEAGKTIKEYGREEVLSAVAEGLQNQLMRGDFVKDPHLLGLLLQGTTRAKKAEKVTVRERCSLASIEDSIEQMIEELENSTEEEVTAEMQTQGHKGEKLPRINLALTRDNYKFVITMARAKGMTITKYVNTLVAQERVQKEPKLASLKKALGRL